MEHSAIKTVLQLNANGSTGFVNQTQSKSQQNFVNQTQSNVIMFDYRMNRDQTQFNL